MMYFQMIDCSQISISSKSKKHDPTYYLAVSVSGSGATSKETKLESPFTTWFTADGFFVPQPLQKWLATSIPTIGEADPKNASKDGVDISGLDASQLDSLLKSATQATGADVHPDSSKKIKRKA